MILKSFTRCWSSSSCLFPIKIGRADVAMTVRSAPAPRKRFCAPSSRQPSDRSATHPPRWPHGQRLVSFFLLFYFFQTNFSFFFFSSRRQGEESSRLSDAAAEQCRVAALRPRYRQHPQILFPDAPRSVSLNVYLCLLRTLIPSVFLSF